MAAKVRPCLVISIPAGLEDRALVTIVPHTTSVRGSRFECDVAIGFLRPGAFDVQGISTVPEPKLLRRIGRLEPAQLAEVEEVLAKWLGLRPADSVR